MSSEHLINVNEEMIGLQRGTENVEDQLLGEEPNQKENEDGSGRLQRQNIPGISLQTSSKYDEDQKLIEKLRQAEIKPERKVQEVVLEINRQNEKIKEYFGPREFSVGPRHVNDSNLSKEELKIKLASKFIKDSNKPHESFLKEINNNIVDIRNRFGEGIIPESYKDDNDSLARLLFLDGCAVLEFIHCCGVTGGSKKFNISSNQEALIKRDLFLFENQIPFKVLKLLMDVDTAKAQTSYSERKCYKSDIVKFVYASNICSQTDNRLVFNHLKLEVEVFEYLNPDHLLDLLWMVSIYGSLQALNNKGIEDNTQPQNPNHRYHDQTLFNVQKLKSFGIKLKPSDSRSLRSVSFSTPCFGFKGHLKLPALVVDKTTVCKLNNLAAFEIWVDRKDKCQVTCFLNFLDMLIDTEEDVKHLRAAHILQNRLGNDEKVAQLVNGIGRTYFTDPNQNHFYDAIMSQIEDHCKHNKRRVFARWMAQVRDKYFSSPVTTVAFIYASIALLLTVVQTIYTINPKR